ncbi:MAG: hypothetical protein NVS9B7_20110 [Flavisolibacter sp.]
MKMKISSIFYVLSFSAVVVMGCKKNSSSNLTPTPDAAVELTAQSDDQSRVSGEIDALANDANSALDNSSNMAGKIYGSGICDATVVADTVSNPRTLTISYNGTNCIGSRIRSGTVVLSIPAGVYWKNAGAAVTIQIQNLKVTRLADNKTITLNGTKTMTNVSGGLLKDLASLQHITHTITSSQISITFDDGTQRIWQIARQRDFTYSNGIVIAESGTHTEGNTSHVAEWGINRSGHSFTTAITTPIVVRQDCNFRIVSGVLEHVVPSVTATATFGLDANGNPTSCPLGNYYLKITWTVTGGTTKTVIAPY